MATLDAVPTGLELEDYVAGLLQAGGYYIEKGITERGEANVLELDIVATSYETGVPKRKLFEIKSGKSWGFSDIFKFLGWKTYLGEDVVDEAYFITANIPASKKSAIPFYTAKCEELGITFLAVENHTELSAAFVDLGLIGDDIPDGEHEIWRFSLWVERQMIDKVRSLKRDENFGEIASTVIEYYELVNNGVFFSENVRHSMHQLYESHFEHQKLGRDVATEIAQIQVPGGSPTAEQVNAVFDRAMYDCDEILIQAAWYVAHRARLAIVKGVVDYACLENAGELPQPKFLKLGSIKIPIDDPPPNFISAVKEISGHKHFRSIPRALQSYMWKWGGYLLEEFEEDELVAIGKEAGADAGTVRLALKLYDQLFSGEHRSWLTRFNGTEVMKIFPGEFRGIGSHWRLAQHGHDGYDKFGDPWAKRENMRKWNNAAVKILENS